ncbi:hypothetical protein [Zavarzinella formosa]|uniref:hypothetical protein n=1 Tax=Zavarzinella formosa TaxID=360055 RepID=UPI00030D036E|nr:hypothetical protein [Zavarzinella formosa]
MNTVIFADFSSDLGGCFIGFLIFMAVASHNMKKTFNSDTPAGKMARGAVVKGVGYGIQRWFGS